MMEIGERGIKEVDDIIKAILELYDDPWDATQELTEMCRIHGDRFYGLLCELTAKQLFEKWDNGRLQLELAEAQNAYNMVVDYYKEMDREMHALRDAAEALSDIIHGLERRVVVLNESEDRRWTKATEIIVRVNKLLKSCPECLGLGKRPKDAVSDEPEECPVCKGSGVVLDNTSSTLNPKWKKCKCKKGPPKTKFGEPISPYDLNNCKKDKK